MKNLLDIFFDMRYTSLRQGVLAQLGEHLPYKQRVIGSSPIGPIFMFEMKKNVFMRMHRGVFCVYDEPSTDLCLHKNLYLANEALNSFF